MHRYTLSYFVDSIVVLLLFAFYSHEYDKCGRVTRITPRLRQDRGADLQLLQLGTPARGGKRTRSGKLPLQ